MFNIGRNILFAVAVIVIAFIFMSIPRRLATPTFLFFIIYPLLSLIIFNILTHFDVVLNFFLKRIKAIALAIPVASPQQLFKFRKSHLAEVLFLLVCTFLATRPYYNFDPVMRSAGHEVEWLTGYGQVAYQGLQETGTIPLWNPYYRHGEPLIDNAFSYILNPFSSVAQLLTGATQGVKYSIFINAAVAAIGGWFLGMTLGLSRAGRIVLALLILGKGNMHANFFGGYYQLATQQVYFAWAMAGVIAMIRQGKRWSIVLTALSMALMFLAGNLWHLLPMSISIGVVVLLYSWSGRRIEWIIIRRLMGATVITLGLCAVILLSVIGNFNLIEEHPDEVRAGWETIHPHNTYFLPFIADYYFSVDNMIYRTPARHNEIEVPSTHFYYSFVTPWWYVLLLLLPIPVLWKKRQDKDDNRKLWVAGIGLYFFFTWWGMGGTPLFIWLYEHISLLGQWRFVPRALGMASFWVAVLVAMRFDNLICPLFTEWQKQQTNATKSKRRSRLYAFLLFLYGSMTVIMVFHVNQFWPAEPLRHMEPSFTECMSWLRQEKPNEDKVLWVHGYNRVTNMIENEIRLYNIEADFLPGTAPNTIGEYRLDARKRTIELRTLFQLEQISWFLRDGFQPLEGSPPFFRIENCIYENPDYHVPYAFTFNLADAPPKMDEGLNNPVLTDVYLQNLPMKAIETVVPIYDTIGVLVESQKDTQQVLVIQELAYPGWEVWIDGERYQPEIFAKWNAVKLPMAGQIHEVIFMYRPPLLIIGSIITLITSAFCVLYLLGADRILRRS